MKTVYADTVFLINLCIDYLLLFMTSRFLHIKVQQARMIISSVLGGMYAFCISIVSPNFAFRIISLIVWLAIMCVVSFGKRGIRTYVRIYVSMLIFSVFLGGTITMLVSKADSSFKIIICLFAFTIFVTFIIKTIRTDLITKQINVAIFNCGNVCELTAMCDSGNLLVDLYTCLPVVLIDENYKSKLFEGVDNSEQNKRIRLVPVKTVNGRSLVEVMTPDKVIVSDGTNKMVEAAVGFVNSECFDSSECGGIIPKVLIDNL